jgi:hypothetical protein
MCDNINQKLPINIYFSSNLYNETNNEIRAQFNTTNSSAIIDEPSSYCIAIERLAIDAHSIPLFFFRENYYSITLKYKPTGDYIQTYLNWVEYRNPPPVFYSEFRSVYYFQHLIEMVNNALSTAYTNLVSLVGPLPPTAPSEAPVLIYDIISRIFSFELNEEYEDINTDGIEIYMNLNLFKLFRSFFIEYYTPPTISGMDRRIVVYKDYYNYKNTMPRKIILSQQYESIGDVYQLNSILIATQMPVISESIGSGNYSNNKLGLLTDFIPYPSNSPYDNNSVIIHNPTQHRWIDLQNSNQIFNVINWQIFFSDNQGGLYPLFIGPEKSVKIKFVFRRKDKLT